MRNIIQCCILLFLSGLAVLMACDLRPVAEKKADQEALAAYNQLCELIEPDGTYYGKNWQAIQENYRQGKKVLFIAVTDKASIVVLRNTGEYVKGDSTQPVDTAAASNSVTNILSKVAEKTDTAISAFDKAIKKTEDIAKNLDK